jgi:hypothetical protein
LADEQHARLLRRIRITLAGFVVGLILSGITAFPLPQELRILAQLFGVPENARPESYSGLLAWIVTVRNALLETDAKYPFLAYGTDWLAFGHLVIALAFVGPWKDPVRNVFVIQWGMAACVLILPLAMIFGPMRGIPPGWQIIDCMFGIVGIVPLWLCLKWTRALEKQSSA